MLSEARFEDKKYILELERKLRNCSQQIEYLQDQLNLRKIEANCLGEHVHSLELKLIELGNLNEKVSGLNEEVMKSNNERFLLIREVESKEVELQNSTSCIEKLEESISTIALDSQCEIESMKLDLMALEQRCCEAKRFQEETIQEKASTDSLIHEFKIQLQDSVKMIESLEKENKELKDRLEISGWSAKIFCQKLEEHLGHLLGNEERRQITFRYFSRKQESELLVPEEFCICEEVMGPLLSKLAVVAVSNDDFKDEMEKMSSQICESELLVQRLKEELRVEKEKSKEEAEDLTQEMAELRYQITEMLEQECKRRACIEQASLQRIAELETQVKKEHRKSSTALRHLREVQKIVASRSRDTNHLSKLLGGVCDILEEIKVCSCGECGISMECLDDEPVEAKEVSEFDSTDIKTQNRAAIERERSTKTQSYDKEFE